VIVSFYIGIKIFKGETSPREKIRKKLPHDFERYDLGEVLEVDPKN